RRCVGCAAFSLFVSYLIRAAISAAAGAAPSPRYSATARSRAARAPAASPVASRAALRSRSISASVWALPCPRASSAARPRRAAVIAQGTPADADVVLRLGHAAQQASLLVGREGQLVARERGARIAPQVRDDPQIVEAPRFRGVVLERARQLECGREVRLGRVDMAPLQRDRPLIVARP